jgi:hypothetical protein
MELEMCSYLEWLLHIEAPELESFTQRVKKEYGPDCDPNPPQWVSTPTAAAPVAAPAPITPSNRWLLARLRSPLPNPTPPRLPPHRRHLDPTSRPQRRLTRNASPLLPATTKSR